MTSHWLPGGSFTKMFDCSYVEFVRPVLAYQRNSRRDAGKRKATRVQCKPKQCNSSFVRSVRGFYDELTGRKTHLIALWKTPLLIDISDRMFHFIHTSVLTSHKTNTSSIQVCVLCVHSVMCLWNHGNTANVKMGLKLWCKHNTTQSTLYYRSMSEIQIIYRTVFIFFKN